AELGDRRFRQLIARYLAAARAAVRRHGGREIDTAGDGMFATFDTPASALRAALESTTAVRAFGLEIRSGVHVGEVEQDPDGRVGGISVHFGARVMGLAGAGEVLTSRATSELSAGGDFQFEDRGTHELKGIPGRHDVVAVAGWRGAAVEPALALDEARRRRETATVPGEAPEGEHSTGGRGADARPFVGRAAEVDQLKGALSAATDGHGSLVLISGEPGIGKSRLIATIAELAEAKGWAVLVGRCWEGGGAPAYWPWIQVVRQAGAELSDLVGEASGAGAHAQTARDAVSESSDPDTMRFQLFDAVGRYLTQRARERPCLIALEDLHAADESSLLLLRFVAGAAKEHPLVLLGSYRDHDQRVRELAEVFGALATVGRRIRLQGLSPTEIAAFVTLMSGDTPPDAFASRIEEVTAGNPFFVGEILRELAVRGARPVVDDAGALPLPDEVRALIRRRMVGLSEDATEVLRIAVVVGREFDLRVISSASMLEPERIVDALAETEAAGVIVGGRESPGTYSFAHELLRETLYTDLPSSGRMKLHRTVAEGLEHLFRDDLEPRLAEIAHHLAAAAPLGDAERAVDFSIRAGDRSRAVLAYEDAAKLYERALRILGPTASSPDVTARIHLKLGDAHSRAGKVDEAQRSFDQAAEMARRSGWAETFALAALGYGAAEMRGSPGRPPAWIRSGGSTTSIALLEDSLAMLPADDSPVRAQALAMLAMELYTTERRDRGLALSREALEMATRLGDRDVLLDALHARHWALFAPDTVRERLANADQLLVVSTESRNDEFAFIARHARAHCFLELCDARAFHAEVDAMDELATRVRQPLYAWHVATLRGVEALLRGSMAEAEALPRDAADAAGLGEAPYVHYWLEYAERVALRWAEGRSGLVFERLAEHAARFPGIPRWREALVAADMGDHQAARRELERFAPDAFAALAWDGLWLLHACALAEAAVLVRDEDRAASLYELLLPFADRNAQAVATLPFGPVAHRLGMLATLQGRWDEANAHFELAERLCDGMVAPALRARVLIEHAGMRRRRAAPGDEQQAERMLGEAATLCDRFGLVGLVDRIRSG
ncbi:MAG TPA: AAA family ATPase, partial [Actinomycetota bacterium]|nr:AAA family ATPase [Actinomycetota bacterium]